MGSRKAAAAAQAQAAKEASITYQDSLELVRCLLRVSVYHVSYLRQLFPDDEFKGVKMNNLEGMNVQMLEPKSEESQRLKDWVELGAAHALKEGYLKAMYFGISRDLEGTELLEEYVFNFSYGSGGVSLQLNKKTSKGGARSKALARIGKHATVDTVRYQISRLMRMLVEITNTLDEIPRERYIFMKLTYHDHTPEDYEPPFFNPASDGAGIGHFSRRPFGMAVGAVDTDHHLVELTVKTLLDSYDAEAAAGPEAEGEQAGSQQLGSQDMMDAMEEEEEEDYDDTHAAAAAAAAAADHGCGWAPGLAGQEAAAPEHPAAERSEGGKEGRQAALPSPSPVKPPHLRTDDDMAALAGTAETGMDLDLVGGCGSTRSHHPEDDQQEAQYLALRHFCSQRSQVNFVAALSEFVHVPIDELESGFLRMQEEGVLKQTADPNQYLTVTPKPPAAAAGSAGGRGQFEQEEQLEDQLAGLSMAQGNPSARQPETLSAAAAGANVAGDLKRADYLDPSCVAAAHEAAGSGHTCSELPYQTDQQQPLQQAAAAAGSPLSEVQQEQQEQQQQPHFYLDCSQHSLAPAAAKGNKGRASSRKKASYVAAPIHQSKGVTKKKTPAASRRMQRMQ